MSIYTFDQTGLSPANLVVNEEHSVLTVSPGRNNYIVPEFAPFYGTSLTVVDADTGDILKPGQDFIPTHRFADADEHLPFAIYGSFAFTNAARVGRFKIRYQTLGGAFVTSVTAAIKNGLNTLANLQSVDWTELSGTQPPFPPTEHTHPVTGIEGVTQHLDLMRELTNALKDPNNKLSLEDVTDLDAKFIEPLLASIRGISGAIEARDLSLNASFEQWTSNHDVPDGNLDFNGVLNTNQWYEVTRMDVPASGSWKVHWEIPRNAFGNIEAEYELRYQVIPVGGGLPADISTGKINDAITPLAEGMTLVLQIRTKDTQVGSRRFSITRNYQPTFFQIIRMGN